VSELSIKNDNQGLDVFVPEEIIERMKSRVNFSDKDFLIAIAPSAKHGTKAWLMDRFAQLGDKLIKEFKSKIILLGGGDDIDRCSKIARMMNSDVINLCGMTTLLEASAILKLCKLLVTNDSGLMHIGSAMGTKIVAIFGSTVKEFGFFPHGTRNIVVEKNLSCRPCSHIGRDRCPRGHFKCMTDIQVDDVFKACIKLLEE
jgi:heptosyltransferase-2